MNWRLFTTINAIIAVITVSAVIFDLTRPRTDRVRNERSQNTFQPNSPSNRPAERTAIKRIDSADDLTTARVDDLGAVPAVELTEIMRRATPEQLAAMALKFNDAPIDARTFGGMAVFFQAWTELDPKQALIGAFRINDVAMRELAARTVVNSVSPSAASGLITFLTEHPDKDLVNESKNEFLQTLVTSWSQLDPEAASRFVDDLGDTKNSLTYGARGSIAYNWATLDPSAAIEWIGKQKGKEFIYTANLYDSVIRGWCRNDIDAASAYVAQHLDESGAGQTASSVVTALFDHNNIDQARDWLGHMPAGDPRNEAESTMASLWSAKDPSSAANWLATLPANEQPNLARTIASDWVETNWTQASRWISTLTGDVRDEALAAAVNREGATEVESLTLALSIVNEETRRNSMEGVIRGWASVDANAAEAWVRNSPLSDEQRDHLRSVISEIQHTAEVEQ